MDAACCVEVFTDADALTKFLRTRARYLFAVLAECMNNVAEFRLADHDNAKKRAFFGELHKLDTDAAKKLVVISACDCLMSATDWVESWSTLLGSLSSVDDLCNALKEKFGVVEEDGKKKMAGESKYNADPTETEATQGANTSTSTKVENKKGDVADGVGDGCASSVAVADLALNQVNFFVSSGLKNSTVVGGSDMAKKLCLPLISRILLHRFQLRLELAMWKLWSPTDLENKHVVVDPAAKKSTDLVMVKYPMSSSLELQFEER